MSKRIFVSFLSIALLAVVLFQSSAYSVSAEDGMTTPVTFFNLVGKVTYKQLGRLAKNTDRISPASDVDVTVKGFFDKSKTFETTTDGNGNYSVQVPAGLYSVEVNDESSEKTDFFVPPFTVKKVQENKTQHADFQGLVFP